MICKMIHFLYWLFPINRWKAFLIKTHFSHCEKCQDTVFSDSQIKSLLISPQDILPDTHFWENIESIIRKTPEIRKPIRPKYRPFIFPKWQWIAGALIIIGLIILIPLHTEKKPSKTFQNTSKNQIVLKSIAIEETPARAYFYQSKNSNRLIIWAQKVN